MPEPSEKLSTFDHLVVIGSSAGGITALSTLVATLPLDFPAPIVIAQHLDPSRASHLGEILARRSTLPVRILTEHEALAPGVVFVVPSNRNVEITDHAVRLNTELVGRSKPSVDVLLSTAAALFGENLVAVILTGSGSDGAAGARAVKAAGGTVVIQDPETAEFPSMPRALAPTSVDVVSSLENMGAVLYTLVTGVKAPRASQDERALGAVLAEVRTRQGLDFTRYKMPTILRRVRRRMAATGTTTLSAYQSYLLEHPGETPRLVNSLLINVTEFFRDPALFEHLRQHGLPDILALARAQGTDLRIWSAGCATGEEAYSLAILIAEMLGPDLEQVTVRLFATDVDGEAITFARRGIYPAAALTSLTPALIERYFIPIDGAFEVSKRIRGLIVFGEHDLAQRPPFPRIDLVLCRNVLIYFTPELQTRALRLFAFALRDRGYLVLGKAETPRPLNDYFECVDSSLKIYQRHGARTVLPPTWSKEATAVAVPRARTNGHRPEELSALESPGPAEVDPDHALEEPPAGATQDGLLDDIPLGVVVVDRRYDILTINRAARLLLGVYHEVIGEDLIHLAQSLPGPLLRAAIDAAFRDGSSTRLDQVVPVVLATGEERSLEITCRSVQLNTPNWEAPTVMILLNDHTAAEQARASQEDEIARLTARVRDMAQANQALLAANAALTTASTALRQDTVEARADTADAQAQTEEVITLNEELQATNEEMETLNEELQATIEEVETANDELDSRRLSLIDLNSSMETERAYLELILGSIGDAVLVVDINGTFTRTNAAYDALFGQNTTTMVFLDEQGNQLPYAALPRHRAASGETFNMVFRSNAADGTQHWFEANGRPLLTPDGGRHGVVVIRDITMFTQHQRLQDEFLSLASHELRTPLTSVLGYLGMLERGLRDPIGNERLRGFAAKALHEAERLVLMVRDLTDVSRLQSGKLTLDRKPLDFAALITQVVELARDLPPGHAIHLETASGPMTIYGDATRLEQVLFNIFTNSMFHAPSDRPIEVRLQRLDGGVHLEIEDHGRGIAPDQLPRLFSRFYQIENSEWASRQGMGLGLFICKELVTAHGGRIEVASTEGEGTTFTVWLPLSEAGAGVEGT